MTQTIGHWQKHKSALLRFASQLKGRKRELCVVVKALICMRAAQVQRAWTKGWQSQTNLLVTSWGLSQIRNEADKKQILLGGIMLFLSCQCPSLYNFMTKRCETASLHPGEFLEHSHLVLNVFIPSDEAYLLIYTGMRDSCHVLEDVINHQSTLRLISGAFLQSTWFTVLQQWTILPLGHSHPNLIINIHDKIY